jgi:hypothetical protein
MTAVGTIAIVATHFTSLYPRTMVSSPESANSLTAERCGAVPLRAHGDERRRGDLRPLVLLYQGWTH